MFDKNGCASAYGIGTYIRNVITACVNSLLEVTVVTLHVKGSLQCKVDERGIRYINIPSRNEIDLNDKNGQMLFSEYIVSILRGYVSNTDKNIFHLNYTQDYYLAESFKKTWPLDKVVVTIHYFTWCFALFGNTNRLSQIVVKRREELSNFEQEVIYASLFEQRLFQIVDCIIGLSDFACQVLTNFYDIPANKICLIPNGLIDLSEKKGERVKRLIWRNIDLLENPETKIKIVLNSYRASGTGGYDVYRKMRNIRAISVDIQDALIASFENRVVEVPSKTDFSVIN